MLLASIDWPTSTIIGGGILFAFVMAAAIAWDARKFRASLVTGIEEGAEQVGAELWQNTPTPTMLEPEFETVDEIHAHYAKLKETDPLEAGVKMYRAQLKLHGR